MRLTVVPVQPTASATVTRARASVVVTIPLASVGAEILASEVEYSAPVASVTAVFPIAEINYILLTAATDLDTSGLYRYVSHTVELTENIGFTFFKTELDEVTVPEFVYASTEKLLTDRVTIVEDFTKILEYIRKFTDTPTLIDALTFEFQRPLFEDVSAPDAIAKAFSRPATSAFYLGDTTSLAQQLYRADTAGTWTDSLSRQFAKQNADAFSFSHALTFAYHAVKADVAGSWFDYATKDFTKSAVDLFTQTDSYSVTFDSSLTDSFYFTDAANSHLEKSRSDAFLLVDLPIKDFSRPLYDTLSTSGYYIFEYTKSISDGFALNDLAESLDGLFVINSKSVSNVVFATEALQRSAVKLLADEQAVLSSGSLRAQNYCDFTYFAEDYVGESRIF